MGGKEGNELMECGWEREEERPRLCRVVGHGRAGLFLRSWSAIQGF